MEAEKVLPFVCFSCNKRFMRRSSLREHTQHFHQNKFMEAEKVLPFVCFCCNKRFLRRSSLREHVLHFHQNSDTKMSFRCQYCQKYFQRKKALNKHGEPKFSPFLVSILDVSIFVFYAITHMYKSLKCQWGYLLPIKISGFMEAEKVLPFVCFTCKKRFMHRSSLREHALHFHQNSDTKLSFRCQYCQKYFQRKKALNMHIRMFHKDHYISPGATFH
ncbi:Oocyte zinc finger protein XlCOF6 [Nymphon striatum]|nr:Oocyte zinc finger protein XlCOF6 [Nymphon striatum]